MAAPQPLGRRPSGSFPSDFPAGADPRLGGAHAYAPHQSQPFPPQASDPASTNYQYTSGRAPFEPQLPFDGASGSQMPLWFYAASQAPSSQAMGGPGLPYHLDAYAQPAPAAASNHIPGAPLAPMPATNHAQASAPGQAAVNFTPKSAPLSSAGAPPFAVGPSGHVPPPSIPDASHSLGVAATATVPRPPGNRRSSDESANLASAGLSLSEAGSSVASGPVHGSIHSAPESAGFNGSISPNSSARISHSPEGANAPRSYHAYATAPVPPLATMAMGAPSTSASMMDSIESWLAPAPSAAVGAGPSSAPLDTLATAMSTANAPSNPKRKTSPAAASAAGDAAPSSSQLAGDASFHPGSSVNSSTALGAAPFKTSMERRERNKASQRESRKRKQDRLETLETENATLRKALADTKKFSQAISNGAGIRGEDGAEVAPVQLTKFTGAFHLDLIESHLEDESQEAEWQGMIGHRFPASTSQAKEWNGDFPAIAADTSHLDEENRGDEAEDALKGDGDGTAADKGKATAGSSSRSAAQQQVKKAMWAISLNQRRNKAAQSFPSMVAVPELVLYKVCRLYFSTLLPFTTKLKSGIVNLRAARETPSFVDGCDDLPRFPGDPSFGASDLYLPKNLMPTEMQMRIGFHPVEIAVLPYPAMRDRILTILSAFHAIEELAQEEEDAARFSEDAGGHASPSGTAGTQEDKPTAELSDEDIRKRTALVADMSAWKPKDHHGAVVIPDKARVYSYGFLEKPRGSHRLRKPAQRWLDEFFYEVVQTLRVWSPAGDVFDGECFEFKESMFRKYPYMVDGEILRATNRWRRARGEDPIRL